MDLTTVITAADLGQLLKIVRSRADLRYREIEQASAGSFFLSKAKIGDALAGKFPRKDFLATFLTVCGVPPDQRKDWLATWERLAPTCTTSGRKARVAQVVDEADQLERDARARADTILRDAQQRAERLDEETRTRADTLLHDARVRAERLDEETRTRADIVLRDAHERAERLDQDAQARVAVVVFEGEERAARLTRYGQARATEAIHDGEARAAELVDQAQARATELVRDAEDRVSQAEARATQAEERAAWLVLRAEEHAAKLVRDGQTQAAQMARDADEQAKRIAHERVDTYAAAIVTKARTEANNYRDATKIWVIEETTKTGEQARAEAAEVRAEARRKALALLRSAEKAADKMIDDTTLDLADKIKYLDILISLNHQRAQAIDTLAYVHRRWWQPLRWRLFTNLAEYKAVEVMEAVLPRITSTPESLLQRAVRNTSH